jgi:hypothetical protein
MNLGGIFLKKHHPKNCQKGMLVFTIQSLGVNSHMRLLSWRGGVKINEKRPKSLKTQGKIRIFLVRLGPKIPK